MLLRSRFFWNLTLSYVLVLLLTTMLVGFLVGRGLERALVRDLEETLQDAGHLVEPLALPAFRDGIGAERQAQLIELGARTGLRFTLIRADGVAVGDSDEDPLAMGDHGSRPEVEAAREAEFGISQRFSSTVQSDMLYVARLVRDGDEELGFVRAAMPMTAVEEKLAGVRDSVITGAIGGFLVALVAGLFLGRRFTAPIAEMTAAAEDLRGGDYTRRVRFSRRDELGILGDTLNRLGIELTDRIASLSRDDARLRAILSGMVEGVVAIDERDRIAFCNDAARESLDLGEGDLEGTRLWERVAVGELVDLIDEARASESHAEREIEILRPAGERTLVAHVSPFVGGGDRGLVVVFHDITKLRRLERVRRDFVANVSHELKTPLTSIKGFVETLLDGALHDEENNERFLRRISANTDRLTSLVSDLLSLARIEARGETIPTTPVEVSAIVGEVLRRQENSLHAKRLVCHADELAAEVVVRGDEEALHQIVGNLLDNAIKYTPEGGEIHLRLRVEARTAILEVQDSGIGIPAREVDRVFERFYRVDKGRSREIGGTGLGLSIVKNLVLKMGGEISVESEEGVGTRFVVKLALA